LVPGGTNNEYRHIANAFTLYATFMTISKLLTIFFLTLSISGCSQMDNSKNLARLKDLSEKTGIEMIVIDEAEKITMTEATRFVRSLMLSSYIDDPIHSTIRQESPKGKTVELPGVSFLVEHNIIETIVDSLNKKFAYRQCLAFISNDDTRNDRKQTVSIIHSADKYNALRLQQTSGGSYLFSTDSLIEKLQAFEKKYSFHFIGVGDDWLLIKTNDMPKNWTDFAKEVLKVCPTEDEVNIDEYAEAIKNANGKVSMWWD
jgi:hypothetical protein